MTRKVGTVASIRDPDLTMNKNIKDHMFAYLEKGFSIIPIGIDKKPLISKWKEYQSRKPTKEEIIKWCETLNPCGIGIITGKISGIVVLDIDVGADTNRLELPPTPSVKTGGGGWHHYYRPPLNVVLPSHNGFRHKMDFKAEGGYVIAPPSQHKSGNKYKWIIPFERDELTEMPEWLIQNILPKNTLHRDWKKIIAGVGEGERNISAVAYIGKLLHSLKSEDDWESVGWGSVVAWNEKNSPRLPDKEIRSAFDSIASKEKEQREKLQNEGSQASKLIKLILSTNAILFHDQYRNGHIAINNDGSEIQKIQSKQFRSWVAKLNWDQFKKPIRGDDARMVVETLNGIALYDKPQYSLCVRSAEYDNALWYDLGKSAVKITRDGWEIIDNPPILFRRHSHQELQVTPVRGGSISQLLDFINIKNKEEGLLIQIWCIAGIIPNFPHPFSIFHGPQGSAKSTAVSVLKQLLDPSQIKLSSPPDNFREFIQLGSHHWFLPIDNLSRLPEWLSDALCRACTGEGFSKRELYSDDDDVVYSFQNVGSLNGINLVVEKPDLLERCIIFGLEKIEAVESLSKFNQRLKEAKPLILGAIFDTVVEALKQIDNVKLETRFRMSDFVHWGCAIALALGYQVADFTDAYKANIRLQNQEAVDASPIAQAIEAFMNKQGSEWHGTPTELHSLLSEIAEELKIDKKSEAWPKASNWVWKRIALVTTNLKARGIKASRASGEKRIISLVKETENAENSVNAIEEPKNKAETTDTKISDSVNNTEDESIKQLLDF